MADPFGVSDAPLQRLHGAEAAAHDCGKSLNAQAIGEPGLRGDPVLDSYHGEIGAVKLAGFGGHRLRSGGPATPAQIMDADDKKAVSVQRLAGPDHVIPPADVFRVIDVIARDMVRRVK